MAEISRMDGYHAAITLGSAAGVQPVVNPPEQPEATAQLTTDAARLSPESQLSPQATEHDAVVAKVKALLDPKTPPPADPDPCASKVDMLVNSITKPESFGDFVYNAIGTVAAGWALLPAAIISDANKPAACSKPKETTQAQPSLPASPEGPSTVPPESAAPQPVDLAMMAKKGDKAIWSGDSNRERVEIGMEVLRQMDVAAEGKNFAVKMGLLAGEHAGLRSKCYNSMSMALEAIKKHQDVTDADLGDLAYHFLFINSREDGANVGRAVAQYFSDAHPNPDVRAKARTALEEGKKAGYSQEYEILESFFLSLKHPERK